MGDWLVLCEYCLDDVPSGMSTVEDGFRICNGCRTRLDTLNASEFASDPTPTEDVRIVSPRDALDILARELDDIRRDAVALSEILTVILDTLKKNRP